jgi:sulfur-carrier protein
MINLKYFASLKEHLGVSHEAMELPASAANVNALVQALHARGGKWQEQFVVSSNIKVAVNHVMTGFDAPLRDGDEVAFFPPVTGG